MNTAARGCINIPFEAIWRQGGLLKCKLHYHSPVVITFFLPRFVFPAAFSTTLLPPLPSILVLRPTYLTVATRWLPVTLARSHSDAEGGGGGGGWIGRKKSNPVSGNTPSRFFPSFDFIFAYFSSVGSGEIGRGREGLVGLLFTAISWSSSTVSHPAANLHGAFDRPRRTTSFDG